LSGLGLCFPLDCAQYVIVEFTRLSRERALFQQIVGIDKPV